MNNLYRFLRCTVMMAVMIFIGGSSTWGQVTDGVYYITNTADQGNLPNPNTGGYDRWYLWPSVTTNSQTGKQYLTTFYDAQAPACNENGVSYEAYDNTYSHWVVKNLNDGTGRFQLINPKLNKYIVIRSKAEYGDRDVWLDDEPTGNEIVRSYFKLNGSSSPYLISPTINATTDIANATAYTEGTLTLNSAKGNKRYLCSTNDQQTPYNTDQRQGLLQFYNNAPTWTFTENKLPAPTISDVSATGTITITDANGLPAGYSILYTTDGTEPTAATETVYSGPINVEENMTVKAIVVRYGIVLTHMAEKSVSPVIAPTITNNFDGTISLSTTTPGATIYYTTNGDTPDNTSTAYSSSFSLDDATVIKAIAYQGSSYSEVTIYNVPQYDAPIITFDNSTSLVTITSEGTVYYNTGNGTQDDPSPSSGILYTEPFTVSSATKVKAIATHPGYLHSDVAIWPPIQGYLTFEVLTSGTICWKAIGTNSAKTIEYSINDGAWTSITAGSNVTISVNAGDEVRFKGLNSTYATDKSNYSGFDGGTATYDISGNIMSLIYGDNFEDQTTLSGTYSFCSLFKQSKAVSAENLILPATTLTEYCYRAMFSKCTTLVVAPALPATTLATGCYWYLFEDCAITTAPELLATTLVKECYGYMFKGCSNLNYIKCLARAGFNTSNCLSNWVNGVSQTGTFVKEDGITWQTGISGIPTEWYIFNTAPADPVITCDGEFIAITCQTYGAEIYYRLGQTGEFSSYSTSIPITENTVVEAYAVKNGLQSNTVTENCIAKKTYKFADLELSQGPLYYGSNGYEIKEGWNYDSYSSIYGKTEGSTYFNFIELGQLFESSVFSTSDGDIEKVLDPLDGWRVPTNAEWASILGTTRSGSTVNGASNKHYAMIQLADVSGLLIFPDGETITGVELSYMDNTTSNTGITESQLDNYLSQGCIFLPGSGYYNGNWSNGHYYWSSIENNSSTGYDLCFGPSNPISSGDYKDKETYYFPVYFVKGAADEATRLLRIWTYNNNEVEVPYSVNAINGHSSNYAKGSFTFTTNVKVKELQPTYLWFQHADQSAEVYVDNTLVEKHWGGYNAFFVDISNHVHRGINNIKVILKNNEGEKLAPCAGDFNFNATLGEVKLISSPVVPDPDYGYDGFHITSTVTSEEATITVKTSVPTDATITCSIKGENCEYSDTRTSTGEEIAFTTTITNPHLWNGTLDPYLYDVTLTIAKDGVVYHTFKRGYGLRFFEYVIDNNAPENSRFMLNGSPYLLRGVCMHNDLEGKANALTAEDIDNDFKILKELGCNFIRLAHYPHPKEVYDWCDKLGIVVQTEVPCVNKMHSTLPEDYYNHLNGQYEDMVKQHYNHPCIMFWGLSNETTTDDKDFAKEKVEGYTARIKRLDPERWVGYVVAQGPENPSAHYNHPNVDWFGCNIYVGWYTDQNTNNPTNQLNKRVTNIITNRGKPLAYSEYGGGATQNCHSEKPLYTTTRGNHERHDIEYQMWLHEGHIATIKNFPQLLFTSQWQLFDIAVSSRREGYTTCLDGVTVSTDEELKYLNNKGLVERDHKTKKDSFYLYKAWWNQTDKFVHICGKDYEKLTNRAIKCYTNDGNTLTLFVNDEERQTAIVENNIATFTATNFNPGDVIRVEGATANETFTFPTDWTVYGQIFQTAGDWNEADNWNTGDVPTTGDVLIAADATIPSDYVANVGTVFVDGEASLTIADGGQLIHNNEGVIATVQKNITGRNYGGGWNFIASPVATVVPSTANGLLSGDYDLYYYHEGTHKWRNYKGSQDENHANPGFSLTNGKGYLYANTEATTLSFTGALGTLGEVALDFNTDEAAVLPGWNLVGNPFPCNVTSSLPYYLIDGNTNQLNGEPYQAGTVIPSCTGIMVKAEASGQSVTFTKVVAQQSNLPSGLQIAVAQANTRTNTAEDKAIVSFSEGNQLEKFIFDADLSKLYIPQDGKDYAIVTAEAQGEIPVNFRAAENGPYTITVNPENVEMGYLHLIDNMTGADVDLLAAKVPELVEGPTLNNVVSTGSTTSYTFTAKTTDYESRFKLVFSINNEDGPSTGSGAFAFIDASGNIILTANVCDASLQVVDVMGRVVISRQGDAIYRVSTSGMVPGVYVLRLLDGNVVKTQKIVIQ